MTTQYATHFSTRQTRQSEMIPGRAMVQNSTGGFSFQVDDWKRLERFLLLGAETGSYYASEQKLTVENAQCVLRCAAADMDRAVKLVRDISVAGRAPKNDPAIFALAILAGQKGESGRKALDALPDVCRIGTHLFQFLEAVKAFRGRGRSLNRAVANWYLTKLPDALAYQCAKYQQRNGWSHRDILRLVKPVVKNDPPLNGVLAWAVGKADKLGLAELPTFLHAVELAKSADNARQIASLIRENDLPRECVPTQFLNDPIVWAALLDKMPMTAMIRNLATMTRIGLLAPMSDAVSLVCERLRDVERLKKARVHPIALLLAQKVYASGRGEKSVNTWTPIPQVIDALDDAFYLAFQSVEPTGKRWLLACDVSGSMDGSTIAGTSLTAREAVGALALVTAKTEPNYHIVGFTSGAPNEWIFGSGRSMRGGYRSAIVPINLSRHSRLDGVCKTMREIPLGGTDCALPMLYALHHKIPVDVFVVMTDNETWAGNIHPCQALQMYREQMSIPAKLIVMGMVANQFTIADPNDAGMLDVTGFDAAVPSVMADFAK